MTFSFKLNAVLSLLVAMAFSACASVPDVAPEHEGVDSSESTPLIPQEALTGENLFHLFVAEVATNRRELGVAAALYTDIAENYNDVNAIQRAVLLNQSIGNSTEMLSLSKKWLTLRPEDEAALEAYATASLVTEDLSGSVDAMSQWLTINPNADVSILLPIISRLNENQQNQLTTQLEALQDIHPESAALYYMRARLKYFASEPDEALALINQSLAQQENLVGELFKFQLLQSLNQNAEAKSLIEALNQTYPSNTQVAVVYSRYLFEFEPNPLEKLRELHTRFSTDPTIARTFARSAYDQQDYDSAAAMYNHLLTLGFADEAHYFLGNIDVIEERPESAVDHFESVRSTPFFTLSVGRWASLARPQDESRLIKAITHGKQVHASDAPELWRLEALYYQLIGDVDQARAQLNEALTLYPSSSPLLYDSAMLAASIQDFDLTEKHLSRILEMNPNNSDALNSLGYIWADQNINLDLANQYISKALQLEPNNAAFQDSKGWVLYRMGQPEEAVIWLKKAYQSMEIDEIAAHLAEALWTLNKKEEAFFYFSEIKRLNPSSPYIKTLGNLFDE